MANKKVPIKVRQSRITGRKSVF